MVAGVGALGARRAAKLGGEDHERFIKHFPPVKVFKQTAMEPTSTVNL